MKMFTKAVLGGIWMSLATLASLIVTTQYGPIPGAIIFPLGVLFNHLTGAEMFTGYCLNYRAKNFYRHLLLVWLGNIIGCMFIAMVTICCKMVPKGISIVFDPKLTMPLCVLLFKAILCNALICGGYYVYKRDPSTKSIVLYISILISGIALLEHSIANAFLMFLQPSVLESIYIILITSFGNILGGIAITSLLNYINNPKEEYPN